MVWSLCYHFAVLEQEYHSIRGCVPLISQLPIDKQMEMIRRGTIEIIPEEELEAKLKKSQQTGVPLKIKLGLDPTAPDIHLGHAVVLRKLRQLQDLGHEVIIIIGDFTASIGDPTGRSVTRPLLSPEEIAVNARTYEEQYCQILDRTKTRVVFNSEWLGKLDLAGTIRITSKITVARILERDDFATRLAEQRPLGLHEILYPVCQAYDSVALEADVEFGGTDQKFNILMGRDLQREFGQEPQVAIFTPLLVGIDGMQKMSKSLGNYVGITEPPNEMFGKLMSIPDDIMPQYFELCTEVPMPEVRQIEEGLTSGKLHPMEIKKRLAREIVSIYHGEEAAIEAQREFERVFSARELPSDLPSVVIPKSAFKDGRVWIVRLLTVGGFASSNSEARRLIEQGAVTLDDKKVTDVNAEIPIQGGEVLRVGKLKFGRLELE
ncbi:MAG: tyrosine--tRNA ligase [Armatimonadetes bacterium]|nr:tyrosine--tRNA ligase [Armatimonadota bacterium]